MQQLENEHLQLLTENNIAINNAKAKVQPTTTPQPQLQQQQQQQHQPNVTHVPCLPGALVHSNSFNAAQIANEMHAIFGHALSPENAALFSNFFHEEVKRQRHGGIRTRPLTTPPSLEPGQSSDGKASTEPQNIVAQAAKQAEATAQIKATENIQDISDDDYAPRSDDLVSTDESIGDDEMEARRASTKSDEKVYVKRTTRKSKNTRICQESNNN